MYVMGASSPVRVSGFVEYAQAEQYFRLLLEAAPEAMVVTQRDGRIVLVNTQTERLFGYPREELLGQNMEMLLPQRFRHRHVKKRAGVLHSSESAAHGYRPAVVCPAQGWHRVSR